VTAAGQPGERTDFEAFFKQNHARLHAWLRMMGASPDEAQEVAQDAFVMLWGKWGEVENPLPWVYTVVRRTYMRAVSMRSRQASRELPLDLLGPEPPDFSTDAAAVSVEFQEVLKMISRLPPVQRNVFVLSALYGIPSKEIAAELGISPATVRSNLRHGRARLAEVLAEQRADETDNGNLELLTGRTGGEHSPSRPPRPGGDADDIDAPVALVHLAHGHR
jgi:RNA polymerase sigma factor (sigma-70 family)